jgi:hypothetical protein
VNTEVRDSSSWWLTHAGKLTLVIIRRIPVSEGGPWMRLEFSGKTRAECEGKYDAYCSGSYERSVATAERRARWGPLGTGKLS